RAVVVEVFARAVECVLEVLTGVQLGIELALEELGSAVRLRIGEERELRRAGVEERHRGAHRNTHVLRVHGTGRYAVPGGRGVRRPVGTGQVDGGVHRAAFDRGPDRTANDQRWRRRRLATSGDDIAGGVHIFR